MKNLAQVAENKRALRKRAPKKLASLGEKICFICNRYGPTTEKVCAKCIRSMRDARIKEIVQLQDREELLETVLGAIEGGSLRELEDGGMKRSAIVYAAFKLQYLGLVELGEKGCRRVAGVDRPESLLW